ncbi:MAG TPA: hypothetical protein VNF06_00800 [Candidatus Aquilonibacter sp.]|nr:hypothetical protein [Candidatus Aquilonibacter sp.]
MATNMQKAKTDQLDFSILLRQDLLEIKKNPEPLELKGSSKAESSFDLLG